MKLHVARPVQTALAFALVTVIALLLWQLSSVLLLVFCSGLLAVMLHALAEQLAKRLALSDTLALVLAALLVLGLVVLALGMFGGQMRSQIGDLMQRLPDAWQALQKKLANSPLGDGVMQWLDGERPGAGAVAARVGEAASSVLGVVTNGLLVVIGALYFAAAPKRYAEAVVGLLPQQLRVRARHLLFQLNIGLRRWLLGQLALMLLVGVVTGLGALAIGLPSALALGLLAGLLEFVPIVGPVVAAIPALLLAVTISWEAVLWTLLLYVTVQQIEGYVLSPVVLKRAVDIPPAITLFAVVIFGILFGPLGVLLAAPLAVTVSVILTSLREQDQSQQDQQQTHR